MKGKSFWSEFEHSYMGNLVLYLGTYVVLYPGLIFHTQLINSKKEVSYLGTQFHSQARNYKN
jgi:hypothetical protein